MAGSGFADARLMLIEAKSGCVWKYIPRERGVNGVVKPASAEALWFAAAAAAAALIAL